MLRDVARQWTERLVLRGAASGAARQVGAIPYTVVKGQVVFMLVTSRGTGRWIFPKGDLMKGLEPWEAAAQEALEEAGVEGEVDPQPVGCYRTMKSLTLRSKIVEVEMYPLRVTRQHDDWIEKDARRRHWVILPEAKRLLSDPKAAALALKLSQRVGRDPQPPIVRISK